MSQNSKIKQANLLLEILSQEIKNLEEAIDSKKDNEQKRLKIINEIESNVNDIEKIITSKL